MRKNEKLTVYHNLCSSICLNTFDSGWTFIGRRKYAHNLGQVQRQIPVSYAFTGLHHIIDETALNFQRKRRLSLNILWILSLIFRYTCRYILHTLITLIHLFKGRGSKPKSRPSFKQIQFENNVHGYFPICSFYYQTYTKLEPSSLNKR